MNKFNMRSNSTDGKYILFANSNRSFTYLVTGMENRFTTQSNMRSGYINTSDDGNFANHGGARRI
jgi:hypothetical protein